MPGNSRGHAGRLGPRLPRQHGTGFRCTDLPMTVHVVLGPLRRRRPYPLLYDAVMTDLEEEFAFFAKATEERSAEHRQIITTAVENKWWSIAGSLLRMELDSLIRVNYLRTHPNDGAQILSACVAGLGFGSLSRTEPGSNESRMQSWFRRAAGRSGYTTLETGLFT